MSDHFAIGDEVKDSAGNTGIVLSVDSCGLTANWGDSWAWIARTQVKRTRTAAEIAAERRANRPVVQAYMGKR